MSLAAVIGRDFDTDVLARVAELDEGSVLDLCDRAVTAAVLTEANVAGRYTFAHALIERTLYDSLSAGRRARAHRAVAEALEDLCGTDPAERIGELAYHWAHATQPQDTTKAIAYAQRAGDRALAQLAPDDALGWYRDALALLDRTVDDPHRRAALLVGLGDAQRQTGDAAHRETLLAAARLADQLGDTALLVRAAFRNNRGLNSIVGGVDAERVDVINRALARVGDSDSADRARLLALLCVERLYDTDFDERLSLATQAVDTARRTGDDAALVDAIALTDSAIAMPQTLELRRRGSAEACMLADQLDDPTARLNANNAKFAAALEAGDLATMRAAYAIWESEAERIGQPNTRFQIALHGAWQRMLDGDLDAAEQGATDALTLGSAAGQPDTLTIYSIQFVNVRWMQGRLHELIPLLEQSARDNPGLPGIRAGLAWANGFNDPHGNITRLLDAEVANDFPMTENRGWLSAHAFWAEAAARSAHRPTASVVYQRLVPWHDQFVTTHNTVFGGVAHYLGLLAHTLDRHDEAERWFAQALALHETMEAPYFIAWTQTAWAALLADRNQIGDKQLARLLAANALPVAVERGYGYIEHDAHAVLECIT